MHDIDPISDAVKILRESDPASLIQHKEFNQWLHEDFVPKCGAKAQKQLKTSLSSISARGSTSRVPTEEWKDDFRRIWASKSKTPRKSPRYVLEALEELGAQSQPETCTGLKNIDAKDFWNMQKGPPTPSADAASLHQLLHRYGAFEILSQWGKQGRRFTTLLIWYQVHQELKKAGAGERLHMSEVDSDVSNAIEQVAADHKVDVKAIERRRYDANGWLRFVSQFGPGAMLLPRQNTIYSSKIRADEYLLMYKYCEENQPHILEAVKDLNGVAGRILLEGFNVHRMPAAYFLHGEDNLLTQHFKDHCRALTGGGCAPVSSSEASGLQQLAEIARNLQPLEVGQQYTSEEIPPPGYAAGEPHLDRVHNGQALFLTRVQDGGLMNTAIQTPAWHGNLPNPASMDQQNGYGRDLQTQWQPYPKQVWPPQRAGSRGSRNHLAVDNEDQLPFGSELARATAVDNTVGPAQNQIDERGIDVWDEFVVDDFAGSLYYLQ